MRELFGAVLLYFVTVRVADSRTAVALAGSIYGSFLVYRLFQFQANLRRARNIPGRRYLLTPWASLLSLFLPPIKYINAPLNDTINRPTKRRKMYDDHGSTMFSIVSAFKPRVSIHIADAVAIKHITGDRKMYPKPLDLYRILAPYGENLVITEGDEWRRHRRIVGPAFSESVNQLVWEETGRITKAWHASLDSLADKEGRSLQSDIPDISLNIALCVICSTAFGAEVELPGQPAVKPPPGHKYGLKKTLEGALETLFVTVATPKVSDGVNSWLVATEFRLQWMKTLPFKKVQRANLYKSELDQWMSEIVDLRRQSLALGEEKKDLLSYLAKANEKQEKGLTVNKSELMSDREMAGNLFIFLLAGHETTAHTMAFAMGLLALYPDEQDKLYQEIKEIQAEPLAETPYSDFGLFTRVQAVINETLRMYPPVIGIPKVVTSEQDVVLPTDSRGPAKGEPLHVAAGTHFSLDVQSMHYDPEYWPEPEEFKPDRFIDTDGYKWNRDAFIPFSAGARSCIGSKFAQVELAAVLFETLRAYTISIHPDDEVTGETKTQRRERILKNTSRVTLTPLSLRLVFHRRTD